MDDVGPNRDVIGDEEAESLDEITTPSRKRKFTSLSVSRTDDGFRICYKDGADKGFIMLGVDILKVIGNLHLNRRQAVVNFLHANRERLTLVPNASWHDRDSDYDSISTQLAAVNKQHQERQLSSFLPTRPAREFQPTPSLQQWEPR